MKPENAHREITEASKNLARVMKSLIGRKAHTLEQELKHIIELRAEMQSYGYCITLEIDGDAKSDVITEAHVSILEPKDKIEDEKSCAIYSKWFANANGIAWP